MINKEPAITEFYYKDFKGAIRGPFVEDQMQELYRQSHFSSQTKIRIGEEWMKLEELILANGDKLPFFCREHIQSSRLDIAEKESLIAVYKARIDVLEAELDAYKALARGAVQKRDITPDIISLGCIGESLSSPTVGDNVNVSPKRGHQAPLSPLLSKMYEVSKNPFKVFKSTRTASVNTEPLTDCGQMGMIISENQGRMIYQCLEWSIKFMRRNEEFVAWKTVEFIRDLMHSIIYKAPDQLWFERTLIKASETGGKSNLMLKIVE